MKTITVDLKERSYRIIIGARIIRRLGTYLSGVRAGDYACVVTNPLLKRRYGAAVAAAFRYYGIGVRFVMVPDTEKSKSFNTVIRLIQELAGIDRKKQVFMVALGGGVIGDLTGFAASIYRRGIPYIQLPTTLLAQVDSAIGGKTAVDLPQGKNLAGAFYQPRLVVSDISLLHSLPPRQIASGMAEVIKYAVIKDPQLFTYLEKNIGRILELDPRSMEFIIARCSAIKAEIVHKDEREEKGLRTILNFGHTLGHAIETAAKYDGYTHGEAIALGMLLACDISRALGLTDQKTADRIETLIKKTGLPDRIGKKVPITAIIKSHHYDKKFKGAQNKFVLIRKIGDCPTVSNIPLPLINSSVRTRQLIKNT